MENPKVIYEVLSYVEDVINQYLDKLPEPLKKKLKREIEMLKELLLKKRSPRLMIIGRRGAGKSSLINAIFGERVADTGAVLSKTGRSQYYVYQSSRGKLDILDTRGLGDRTKPETANFQNAIDDIKASIETDYPDAILFLCKAKDVDSNIDADIKNVLVIHNHIKNKHKLSSPIVGVITCVDELEPKRIEPPYDDHRKRTNIDVAVKAVENAFVSSGLDLIKVIPTSAYAEYDEINRDKVVYQNYWNIDALLTYLIDVLPNSTHLELARLAKIQSLQVNVARTIIAATVTITASIAVAPIPLGDIVPITTAQIGMIIGIAYISGRELSQKAAMEFITALGINVGTGMVLREAARALIKFVFPKGGSAISAGVAAAGTFALGEAAILYFIEGKSTDEVKEKFKLIRKNKLESEQSY